MTATKLVRSTRGRHRTDAQVRRDRRDLAIALLVRDGWSAPVVADLFALSPSAVRAIARRARAPQS